MNLKLAFFINLGFTILEIVGGFITNSVANMSDALHDLRDSLSLMIGLAINGVLANGYAAWRVHGG